MTINSEIRKVGPFIGNGTASAFPFTFKVFQASDLEVVKLEVSTNVETVLTLNSQYTVTLNVDQDSNPGGTVTLIGGALASGYTLTLTSDVPYLQPTDLTNQGGFYPDVINDALDRATIQIQQLGVDVNRSLKVPVSSTVSTELPNPSANELLGWNSTGTSLTNVDPSTLATVVAYATAYADVFIGDGVTTSFVLTRPAGSLYNLDVSIQGVTQEPVRDYTMSGTTITFTTAPFDTHRVLVKYKEGLPNYEGDSQDVRYVPSGPGAVATTVQSKLRETVSVKDFGAVGDGVTDDTVAIQNAINSIPTNGWGSIYFDQNCNYSVTSQLNVTNRDVIFLGNNSRITLNADATYLFSVIGERCEFRDLIVAKPKTVNCTAAFYISGINHVFDRVFSRDCVWTNFIHAQDLKESHFTNLRVDNDVTGKTGNIFKLDYCVNNTISNSMLGYCDQFVFCTSVEQPTYRYKCEGLLINNNIVVYANKAVIADFGTFISLSNNVLDFCGTRGFFVSNGQQNQIVNNWIAGRENNFIGVGCLSVVDGVTVTGNAIVLTDNTLTGSTGVSLTGPNCIVSGNRFANKMNGGVVTQASSSVFGNVINGGGNDITASSAVTKVKGVLSPNSLKIGTSQGVFPLGYSGSATSGPNGALPATVAGYIRVQFDSGAGLQDYKIPYYNM